MLHFQNVRKTFGQTVAVDDLTLHIERGEVFGLLGPNGAGKTTSINIALGQIAPDSGAVSVDGNGDARNARVRRKLGVAPQALALYEELSAEDNVAFFAKLYGLSGSQRRQRVAEVLRLVALHDRRNERVKNYSGGMKRRLNIAVALVHDPPLLLLDEPTVGVDPQSRNAIFEFVRQLRSEGRTIVYTTHYMEEAQRLCDRVGIIDHGRLLALDTVDKLIAAHGGTSVVIVERAEGSERIDCEDPRQVVREQVDQPGVLGVHIERPDLESVFLTLTGRSLRD